MKNNNNRSFEPPDFHSQVANFFKFMAAKVSIACKDTFSNNWKVIHRMPCFSLASANTRSMVSFLSVYSLIFFGVSQMLCFFHIRHPNMATDALGHIFSFRPSRSVRIWNGTRVVVS
jgi:hypothetical protein